MTKRLEPGETWRQLEQQRSELPVGQSQQQSWQPQQQHRTAPDEHNFMSEHMI
jgi:hypothetical protein